jgi:hypothetical protein
MAMPKKKVVQKSGMTPMERVDRFRARRSKVAGGSPAEVIKTARAAKKKATPKRSSNRVCQVSVSGAVTERVEAMAVLDGSVSVSSADGNGGTPRTVASWIEQMETKISKALRRGEFGRARELVNEVERRGVSYDPESDVEVGIDDFIAAHFDQKVAGMLGRCGVLTFRQLLNLRPDELRAMSGIGGLYADRLIAFCRAHFKWQDGQLATGPRAGYRYAGTLPPGQKPKINRSFGEW